MLSDKLQVLIKGAKEELKNAKNNSSTNNERLVELTIKLANLEQELRIQNKIEFENSTQSVNYDIE